MRQLLRCIAPIAFLALAAVLAGCPKRTETTSAPDAASPASEQSPLSVQALAESRTGDVLLGITQRIVRNDLGVVVVKSYGVYRLGKDGTVSQAANGLPRANVRSMAVTPKGALLAGTTEGLFRSENDGSQWVAVTQPPQPTVYGLLVMRSGRLMAATSQGLLASADDGKTWAGIGENRGEINVVVEHPTLGVFAGTDKGVIRSADGDNPWEPVGLGKETVLSLAVDSKGNLLAGAIASDLATGETGASQLTVDSLIGWKGGVLRYEPVAAPDAGVVADAGAVKPGKPGAKPVASDKAKHGDGSASGAPPSADAGAPDTDTAEDPRDKNWKPIGLQNTTIWAIAALPDGALLAASHTQGLQRFDPSTSKWTAVQGIDRTNPVASLLVTSTGAIYAGAVEGVFRSTNGGMVFSKPAAR